MNISQIINQQIANIFFYLPNLLIINDLRKPDLRNLLIVNDL